MAFNTFPQMPEDMLDTATNLGYSTNIVATNKWVSIIHIQAKLRIATCVKVYIKTSDAYEEPADNTKNNSRSIDEL